MRCKFYIQWRFIVRKVTAAPGDFRLSPLKIQYLKQASMKTGTTETKIVTFVSYKQSFKPRKPIDALRRVQFRSVSKQNLAMRSILLRSDIPKRYPQ